AEVDENLTDANDRWVKIICERKQGQLSNFIYTMGDLGGNSSFFVEFMESIGEGVTDLIPGDHVLLVFTGKCQDCVHCKSEESNMCDLLRINTDRCVMLIDGKSRFYVKGKPIHHFVRTSTFSEYTVVHVGCLAKMNPATPLDKVYVLSCGISTGFGATVNAAEGARVSGASRIIGADLNTNRFEGAKKFGVTEFVNPSFKWKSSLLMQSHSPRSTRRSISYLKEKVFDASLTWMDNNG
ncbi:hypothetical protein GIB67_032572, partial [Kingdonia uniflora]